jgi:ubiquinone/menaquinone biosynthesis C-methylase UbiE
VGPSCCYSQFQSFGLLHISFHRRLRRMRAAAVGGENVLDLFGGSGSVTLPVASPV